MNIISELNNLQIKELSTNATAGQNNVIININDTYIVTVFQNGLDDYVKCTIFAAQPKTFLGAVNIGLEYESMGQTNFNIMKIVST